MSAADLKRTALYDLHVELGAKMTPFAGYEMPVNYPDGILFEHKQCRSAAALFDVSHMGQLRLAGDDAARALETLVPVDVIDLGVHKQRYALFTNSQGGILDDLMITRRETDLLLVVNAACKDADTSHLVTHIGTRCNVIPLPDRALLALQGPKAVDTLARFNPDVARLVFMTGASLRVAGADCFVTRSGYTGEDGFEVSIEADSAEAFARRLLSEPEVAPAGLGARDSLRLEAGLCLYGHDIDETTSPIEAGLAWSIARRRREQGGFPGAARIQRELKDGAARRRVGMRPEGRVPAREGTEITDESGRPIGKVTSGGFGATAGGPVAMGYVVPEAAKPGTRVNFHVRGEARPGAVAKMPFVPHRYAKG